MSKLGFMQDLIRGIKKLTGADEKKAEPVTHTETTSSAAGSAASTFTPAVNALVKRAFLFLEDGEFERADELCEQALNQEPENAMAYVGKVMVTRKLHKMEALSEETEPLTENSDFQKALRFADAGLKKKLEQYVCHQAKSLIFEEISKIDFSDDATYKKIEQIFQQQNRSFFENIVGQGIDDTILKKICHELSNELQKNRWEAVYQKALFLIKSATETDLLDDFNSQAIKQKVELARKYFDSISEYKDSSAQREYCSRFLDELPEKRNVARKEAIYITAVKQVKSAKKTDVSNATFFERALNALASSIRTFESIPEYKDSKQQSEQCIMVYNQLLEKWVNETNAFSDSSVQLTMEYLEKAKKISKTLDEEVRKQINETCDRLLTQFTEKQEQVLLQRSEELIQQAKASKNLADATWKLKEAERLCHVLGNSETLQKKLVEIEQLMKPLESHENKKRIVKIVVKMLVLALLTVPFIILSLMIKKKVVQVLILVLLLVFFIIPIAINILNKNLSD